MAVYLPGDIFGFPTGKDPAPKPAAGSPIYLPGDVMGTPTGKAPAAPTSTGPTYLPGDVAGSPTGPEASMGGGVAQGTERHGEFGANGGNPDTNTAGGGIFGAAGSTPAPANMGLLGFLLLGAAGLLLFSRRS